MKSKSIVIQPPGKQSARKQFLLAGLCAAALTTSAPALAGNTYVYRSVCPTPDGGKNIADRWYFYQCECVSYVSSKLNEAGLPFSNYYRINKWGNASNWLAAAWFAKVPYYPSSTKPKVGDVAWFSYGHVARVDAVLTNGTIAISEYNYMINPVNYRPWQYGTRTLYKGTSTYPAYFIRFS